MFSLLHGTVFPHLGQFTTFPDKVALSNDFLFPKAIGDLNISLQFEQTTNVSDINNNSLKLNRFNSPQFAIQNLNYRFTYIYSVSTNGYFKIFTMVFYRST